MIPTTKKIRQIILNLPDFFLYSLDEPVILCVTDQRRDTKKGFGGCQGEQGREGPLLVPPDRTPEKFLWCPFPFRRVNGELLPWLDNSFSFTHDTFAMDDRHFSRPYLESLTTRELAVLADESGIDIPPGLERVFIIEELLDLERDEEPGPEEAEEPPLGEADYLEPVFLPKQYNITYIDVLIRDPLWAFAFWEIKGHDKDVYEGAADFEGYYLKVVPLGNPGGEGSFTISVGPGDTAWYLGFPPEGGRFRVDLCALRGETETVLAATRPFRLPGLLAPLRGGPCRSDRLAALSGVEDLQILRNSDRLSRVPRFGNPRG
jgi:hypothetical protein